MSQKIFGKILLVVILILISACQSQINVADNNELLVDQLEITPTKYEMVTVTINSSNQIILLPSSLLKRKAILQNMVSN